METELAGYLRGRLPGSPEVSISNLSRIVGGASRETWMFDATWRSQGTIERGEFVLRRDPPASNLETDREVEFAFYAAFAGSVVPVPRMRWLERDDQLLGSPFFIMDRIDGCQASPFAILEPAYDSVRSRLANQMYEILGAIARFDWHDTVISTVTMPIAPEEVWCKELDRWVGVMDDQELSPQPVARAAVRWLRGNPPPPTSRVSVVHGDYRVGNFLFDYEDIRAIVDWEMAHLGDPLEDLAWSLLENWDWGKNGLAGGIIARDDAIRTWENASGLQADRDALNWWEVFNSIKAQAIWLTAGRSFHDRRTSELAMPVQSYWLGNRQDEILLRLMRRGP